MITSVEQFVRAVNAGIQCPADIFEYRTSEEVRAEIYAMADPVSAEPFRSAMNNLGFINY